MVDLELRNLAHVLGIDIERALSKFEPRLVDGSECIVQVRPGYRGRSHAEELVHRLGRFLDRLNHLMCGRDGEPGWAYERPNEAQPRHMALVVLRLRGCGPYALMQQMLPQIELDRR